MANKAIFSGKTSKPKTERIKDDAKGKEFKNSLFGQNSYVLPEDNFRELTYVELKNSAFTYVPFAGTGTCKDLYDDLYSAFMTSPVNQCIIKKKVSWCLGNKFIPMPKNTRFSSNTQEATTAQLLALEIWLDEQNADGENIDDIFKKVAFDFVTFGNAPVEFTRTTVGSTKVFTQRSIPFSQCRVARLKDKEIEPTVVGISPYWIEGWTVSPPILRNVAIYPLWSVDEEDPTIERSIYLIKNYSPNFFYYGCPDYVAGLISAKNDYEIGKYNNSRLENGFAPSAIISLYGDYTPQEGEQLVNRVEDLYTGTGNNGRVFTMVLPSKEIAPEINVLDDRKEGAFLELAALTNQSLVTAHRWTMSLAGFATAGSLGTNQQIRAEYEFTFNDVIRPMQVELLKWVNTSINLCEEWTGEKFGTSLEISNQSPVSFVNDIRIADVLSIDEQREILGYEPAIVTPSITIA